MSFKNLRMRELFIVVGVSAIVGLLIIGMFSSGKKYPKLLYIKADGPPQQTLPPHDYTIYTVDKPPVYESVGLHIITAIFLLDEQKYMSNLNIEQGEGSGKRGTGNSTNVNKENLNKRQEEIVTCLKANLNNTHVSKITILYKQLQFPAYIEGLNLENKEKIILFSQPLEPTTKVMFNHVNNYMINKVVILMNQDVVLDSESSKLINFERLLSKNLMYALTRNIPLGITCPDVVGAANCDNMGYIGSHDAFIFTFKQKFDVKILDDLNFTQNTPGEENVIIWWFQNQMKYKVLNPCKVIHVFHHHCISLRRKRDPRVNTGGKSGTTGFTTELE